MTKNVILMIGDGMGWEMARAAAIYNQVQAGNTSTSLADFYTAGKGSGLNFQDLANYSLVTTYGTTIADSKGVFSTGNSALDGTDPVTGGSPVRPGFEFNPEFNPGTTAAGGATVSAGAVGNLVGYDPVKGGTTPWDAAYYGGAKPQGFDPKYIQASYPDSANTATTLYTGVKSYNNAIGVDIFEQPLESILVTANLQGKSTGLVTSVPLDHATPGAAAATVNRRGKYDSDFPGLDSILQQELRIYQPTVLLGGGHPLSNPTDPLPNGVEPVRDFTYVTNDTYEYLRQNPTDNLYGYTFLERGANAAQTLAKTAAEIDPNQGDRLVGLYGARGQNGNLPVSSANGDYSTTGLDMFSVFASQGLKQDTQRPLLPGETDASFIARERNENPTLQQLTGAALDVLEKDKDGFWLMVEGGDIDWSAHDNHIDNLIGTMLDFDRTIGSVIQWIDSNGGWENNLLVVTADHDHYLTLNGDYPTLLSGKGAEALTAVDTPAAAGQFWGSDSSTKYGWGSHSNRPVPVYYQGAGSEVLTGYVGQGYESYGFDVPGVAGAVSQSHIYRAMLSAVTGSTSLPMQEGPTTFYGTAKDDVVYTGAFDDTIYANEGSNEIFANNGNNKIYGGSKADVIYTGSGADTIYANEGENSVFAGDGADTIYGGSAADYIYGGAGDDLIYANEGDNTVEAGPGNDRIYGGSGGDRILAGAGNDLIYANEGKNFINSGPGSDMVWTGGGVDTFVLNTGEGFATIHGYGSNDLFSLGSGIKPADLSFTQQGGDTLISAGTDQLAVLKWNLVTTVKFV